MPLGARQELRRRCVAVHRVPAHRRGPARRSAPASPARRCASYSARIASATASRYSSCGLVEVVRLEQRDHAGRRRVQEGLGRRARGRTPPAMLRRSACSGSSVLTRISPTQRGRRYFAVAPALGELLQHARKLHQVLARLARRVAGEPGEAVLDVGGVADLAHLAVAHDVDAGLDLPAHDFRDRVGDRPRCRRGVGDRLPCSRANSTSVTACERGRLPTCVVRMRSLLASTQRSLSDRCCSRCDRRRASA